MIFFFKKKPIVLHCASDRHDVFTFAPVQRSMKFIPEWWKKLPDSVNVNDNFFPSPTMKSCFGFLELYRRGAVIPLWSELALKVGPVGENYYRYQFADLRSEITSHAPGQHNDAYKPTRFQHIKLESPWKFFCKEEIPFLCIEPTWSLIHIKNLKMLPGILEFKYQHGTNQNFFIERIDVEQNFIVPFLTPIMHLVPLSDRPLKIILVEDEKLIRKAFTHLRTSTFLKKYLVNKKILMEQEHGSKTS